MFVAIFNKIVTVKYSTCTNRALEDMLGLNVIINIDNVIVYLGQIEQKANELLNILHYVNLKVIVMFLLTSSSAVGDMPPDACTNVFTRGRHATVRITYS